LSISSPDIVIKVGLDGFNARLVTNSEVQNVNLILYVGLGVGALALALALMVSFMG
jgi:hypothetical protein